MLERPHLQPHNGYENMSYKSRGGGFRPGAISPWIILPHLKFPKLSQHTILAGGANYGTVPTKFRQGKLSPPLLTAKFSQRTPPPPIVFYRYILNNIPLMRATGDDVT